MNASDFALPGYWSYLGFIALAAFLVLLNGFFVAAEFALVKLRSTRMSAIIAQHGWRGQVLKTVHTQLDAYLSACQLGITLASLGLGWVGEPAFVHLLTPLFQALGIDSPALLHGLAFFTAFFIISYLHIVIGELAPKSWAIRQPERLSLWTSVPLYLFYWLMYPAIYLLNASANSILRIAGQGEPGPHHEHHYNRDELKIILHSSRAKDPSDQDMRVLASAVELGELEVADWANSREDLISLEADIALEELFNRLRRHKYSRYPVVNAEGNFIGVLHIKDLLLQLSPSISASEFALVDLLHPIERVSRHMPLSTLLEQFRQGGAHFALVEEADHKVIGFLTMEDVLEALVGDIQDEHRKTERGVLVYQPGRLLVRGDTPLFKVERLLGISLDSAEVDTLAGFIYETIHRLPEEEEVLEIQGLRIIIKKMKGPKILLAKVLRRD